MFREKPQTCRGMLPEQGDHCSHVVVSPVSVKYVRNIKAEAKKEKKKKVTWTGHEHGRRQARECWFQFEG